MDLFALSEPSAKVKKEGKELKNYLEGVLLKGDKTEIVLPERFDGLVETSVEATVKTLGLHWQAQLFLSSP